MPEKLPVLKAKEVLRALVRAGFYIHHQTGSHARLFQRMRPELRVTVPTHAKDISHSLLKRILKQAGLTEEEFARLI
jgi:predicted RNA binding protein YcfA (HicA-like mRNA interferase family)